MARFLHLNNLTFSYDTSPSPLFRDLTLTLSSGWTGIAGANGTGKSTLLKLVSRRLTPQGGTVRLTGPAAGDGCLYVSQETGETEALCEETAPFRDALFDGDGTAGRWSGLFEIGYDWFFRFDTLSFGERKRLQLASALWREPACLCLDEPANHLDEGARAAILRALKQYRGIGLLVSHDRTLLNELPGAVLMLRNGQAVLRPGNWRRAVEEQEKEDLSARKEREKAHREVRKLEREAARRRALAASQQKRRSKRHLDPKDADGRWKLNLVRISGKDGTGGKLLRQMDGRLQQARDHMARTEGSSRPPTGITIRGSRGKGDFLYRRGEESLALGEAVLELPRLMIRPGDRIALCGGNGAGKSTLIRHIFSGGSLDRLNTLYLPQELDPAGMDDLRRRFGQLPNRVLGEVLSAAARLGSDPESIRDSARFSPGEARKVFLAMALCGEEPPELLVLDEPENHLDLPAVRFLEDALEQYDGTLLLVSHDREFRRRLTDTVWRIGGTGDRRTLTVRQGESD